MKHGQSFILAVLMAAGLAGCMSPTPHLDTHFGESKTMLQAQQTLNPEASRNTNPVAGLDGKAAKSALDNYQESYRKTPAETGNVINFNLGGGTR